MMRKELKLKLFKWWERERIRIRYEYKCPYCGRVNVRYEPCARIVCDFCGKSFAPTW